MESDDIRYIANVGTDHQRKHGQYFTPDVVAQFMTNWVLQSKHKELFDPACGTGAFFRPIQDRHDIKIFGMDIDRKITDFMLNMEWDRMPTVRNTDYLLTWDSKYGNIVCNPPYIKFHRFPNRSDVAKQFQEHLGIAMSGYMNTASAFLMKSLAELNDDGRLAYLMPLEFLNTGYGAVVKRQLMEGQHLKAVIQVECEEEVFRDVTTSVGIILVDKARKFRHVEFCRITKVDELSFVFEE